MVVHIHVEPRCVQSIVLALYSRSSLVGYVSNEEVCPCTESPPPLSSFICTACLGHITWANVSVDHNTAIWAINVWLEPCISMLSSHMAPDGRVQSCTSIIWLTTYSLEYSCGEAIVRWTRHTWHSVLCCTVPRSQQNATIWLSLLLTTL